MNRSRRIGVDESESTNRSRRIGVDESESTNQIRWFGVDESNSMIRSRRVGQCPIGTKQFWSNLCESAEWKWNLDIVSWAAGGHWENMNTIILQSELAIKSIEQVLPFYSFMRLIRDFIYLRPPPPLPSSARQIHRKYLITLFITLL
jgi:hypothetical protein